MQPQTTVLLNRADRRYARDSRALRFSLSKQPRCTTVMRGNLAMAIQTFNVSVTASVAGGVINSAVVVFPSDSITLLGPSSTVSGSISTDVDSPFQVSVGVNAFAGTSWSFAISPGTQHPMITDASAGSAFVTLP